MALILNSAGRPEPSPEISRRLRAIHAGLHLRFLDHTGEHWAICMDWQGDDRRWEYVQNGSLNPDDSYDIIGYLPLLCTADQAPSYLERTFRMHQKDEVRNMADAVLKWNTEQPVAQAAESALAEVLGGSNPLAN